ncbi:MAG: class I SAM-dependent methyltransferase [Gemmatimonadaceae bacterium]
MSAITKAINDVCERFPIEGYMTPVKHDGAYATIANTALKYLPPGARILDFGCGPCDKTAILQSLGFECAGCDDLEEDWHKAPGQRDTILTFAKESGIDFRLHNGQGIPFEPDAFDMVMMHDVLEHIHDSPRELLNDLMERTTPEGILFITVPNQVNIKKRIEVLLGRTNLTAYETFYWSDIPWRGHVREYVRDDLVKLADYLGLDILELRGVDHMLQKVPAAARPPYLLATALFKDWKDSWLLVAKKKKSWRPRRALTPAEQKAILPDLPW